MTAREVVVPGWPEPKGYANGRVGEGRTLYAGGQIGWDERRAFPPGGLVPQFAKALDNIAEFKILSSAYQAEYGRSAGGDIKVLTKSGTSQFHGTGYYFHRHEQFNANSFYNNADAFRYAPPEEPVDVHSGIICSPNNFQYDEPLAEGRIRITALARPDAWMPLPEDRYVREKQSWCGQIAASAIRHVPDFRPHVVETDTFTPRTISRFTSHANGAVYGAPEKSIDGRTPFENLYLCGTDQGFLGIVGAMLSGIAIANRYLLK